MSKKRLVIFASLTLPLLVGAFLLQSNSSNQDAPPQLSLNFFGGSALTGQLTSDCKVPGFTPEVGDTSYSNSGDPAVIPRGISMFYSNKELTVDQIVQGIEPVTDNKILLLHYNPIDNKDQKFSIYPPVNDPQLLDIQDPKSYTIPRNNGIILLSCKETKSYNLESSDRPANGMPSNISQVKDNWILAAYPAQATLKEFAILSAWPQQSSGYDNKTFTKVLTDNVDFLELNDHYLTWLKVEGLRPQENVAPQASNTPEKDQNVPDQPAGKEPVDPPNKQPINQEVEKVPQAQYVGGRNLSDYVKPLAEDTQEDQVGSKDGTVKPLDGAKALIPEYQINYNFDQLNDNQPEGASLDLLEDMPGVTPDLNFDADLEDDSDMGGLFNNFTVDSDLFAVNRLNLDKLYNAQPAACSQLDFTLESNRKDYTEALLDRETAYVLRIDGVGSLNILETEFSMNPELGRIFTDRLNGINNLNTLSVSTSKEIYFDEIANLDNPSIFAVMPAGVPSQTDDNIYYFFTFSDADPTEESVATLLVTATLNQGEQFQCRYQTQGLK